MGLAIPPRIRFLKKQEKFNQQLRSSKSTQELIDRLIASGPKASGKKSNSKSSDSGNDSESSHLQENVSENAESAESESEICIPPGKIESNSTSSVQSRKPSISPKKSKKQFKDEKSESEKSYSEKRSGDNRQSSEDEKETSEDSDEESSEYDGKIMNAKSKKVKVKSTKQNADTQKLQRVEQFTFDIDDNDIDDIFTIREKRREDVKDTKREEEDTSKEVIHLF